MPNNEIARAMEGCHREAPPLFRLVHVGPPTNVRHQPIAQGIA